MRVGLLGSLEVAAGDRPVDVGGLRLRTLLVRLALDPGRTVTTAGLVDAVWEDDLPADEVHALQSLVSRLRRSLGDAGLIEQAPGGYRLAVEPGAVDAHRFEQLAQEGGAALRAGDVDGAAAVLRRALAEWRGPALAGVAGERRFATAAAARLEDLRLGATLDRVEADLARGGAPADLAAELDALAAAHPLDERVAAQHVRVLAAAGRQADALAAYERVRARLADELGAVPSPELQAAHLAVLRGDLRAAPPRPRRPSARTNLAAPLTSFVGRAGEIARIGAALEHHRLVTLIGPGGAGKTRLSQQAAGGWVDRMADGVWLVELAPVGDGAEIPQALLGSLQLRETALLERSPAVSRSDAMRRVLDALADRSTLIVLDNCEHLVGAAAAVAEEVLGRCPGVRILATSREPLGIAGERLIDVPPLAWPAPDASAAQALAHPAVELLADRGAAARPGFAVDDENVAAVVEIVRRLDGQPLAIELAAARLRSLSAEQIARRLDDRFRLLTGGSRTAMPRHRTLRAVVDWSWDLLTEPERALAARLAVFPAGVTPESAAAVCATPPVAAEDVLDLLAALVDRSLVQVADPAAPRYRMLETIREYGVERLDERGELAEVRAAHARYFTALAEDADPLLRGERQLAPFALLTAERENAAAALRHLADTGDGRRALRLAVSLLWFGMLGGAPAEVLGWLRLGLEAGGDPDPADRAVAEAIVTLADQEAARDGTEPAGGLADRALVARVLTGLEGVDADRFPLIALARPLLAWVSGDVAGAVAGLDAAGRAADPWVRAAAPLMQAQLAENDGDMDGVRAASRSAVARFRAVGDRWGLSLALATQAGVQMLDGDLDAATAAMDEARALGSALGTRSRDALLDLRLADLRLRRGDLDGAREQVARLEDLHDLAPEEELVVLALRARVAWTAGDRDEAQALRAVLAERLREPGVGARPERGHGRAIAESTVAFLLIQAGDLDAAEDALATGYDAAVATRDMPIVAAVGLVVAALAERRGRPADAAEMLGAAARVRGADDPTSLEVAELTGRLRDLLGSRALDAAYARGRDAARDAAVARLAPASLLDAPPVRP